jgi:hypothetical protein
VSQRDGTHRVLSSDVLTRFRGQITEPADWYKFQHTSRIAGCKMTEFCETGLLYMLKTFGHNYQEIYLIAGNLECVAIEFTTPLNGSLDSYEF